MAPRGRALAFLIAFVAPSASVRAEHGSPGVHVVFGERTLPRNTLVPMHGTNGVPFSLSALKTEKPRLEADGRSIQLRVFDLHDDLEGHARPFVGNGYGENLILFAPARQLAASSEYAFRVGSFDVATVHTGTAVDREPPVWARPPFLVSRGQEALFPATIVTSITEAGALPFFVVVDMKPLQPGARAKRMIATIVPDEPDRSCAAVTLHDHEKNVYETDIDRDLGRRYQVRLTAMDIAGNRRPAPQAGMPIVWTGGLTICNEPATTPPRAEPPPAPVRWLGAPRARWHEESCQRYDMPGLPCVTERIEAPVTATTPVIVDVRLSPVAGGRAVHFMAESDSPSKLAAAPPADRCVRPALRNMDQEVEPAAFVPMRARLTVIDTLGRRFPQPAPDVIFHPYQADLAVCFVATPTAPPPSDTRAPAWRGAELRPASWKGGSGDAQDVLLVDFDEPGWTHVRIETPGARWSALVGPGGSGCGMARVLSVGEEGSAVHLGDAKPMALNLIATDEAGNSSRAPAAVAWKPQSRSLLVCTPQGLAALSRTGH